VIRIRQQNVIISSLAHCQPSLKISCKSVQKFLRKFAKGQTNKQRRLDIRLGGGNYGVQHCAKKMGFQFLFASVQ